VDDPRDAPSASTRPNSGDGAPQLVFFDEDQVLPCYLVDQRNHQRAHRALERAVRTCVVTK